MSTPEELREAADAFARVGEMTPEQRMDRAVAKAEARMRATELFHRKRHQQEGKMTEPGFVYTDEQARADGILIDISEHGIEIDGKPLRYCTPALWAWFRNNGPGSPPEFKLRDLAELAKDKARDGETPGDLFGASMFVLGHPLESIRFERNGDYLVACFPSER